jgi:hypothetical protein
VNGTDVSIHLTTAGTQENMKNNEKGARSVSTPTHLHYQLIRNVTSLDEKENGVSTYIANIPAEHLLEIGTTDNLRSYIAEHSDRKRNSVHKAIEATILDEPDRFINRNGGLTVTCSEAEIDDSKKIASLTNASLINGAQTQGELKRYFDSLRDPESGDLQEGVSFLARVEIIVDPEPAQVTETAIARNSATAVKSISQAGKRGHLIDLATAISTARPGQTIRQAETDTDVIETHLILQCARLLMPRDVSGNESASELLKAYKNKAQCLTDFSNWYSAKDTDPESKEKYRFTVEIAAQALGEYENWMKHSAWNGHFIREETKKGRAVRRDKQSNIVWVAPGLLFPLMSALRAFVIQDPKGKWVIEKPKPPIFSDASLIESTVNQFRAHDSDPMAMGRSAAAYDALRNYTETIVKVLEATKEAGLKI